MSVLNILCKITLRLNLFPPVCKKSVEGNKLISLPVHISDIWQVRCADCARYSKAVV